MTFMSVNVTPLDERNSFVARQGRQVGVEKTPPRRWVTRLTSQGRAHSRTGSEGRQLDRSKSSSLLFGGFIHKRREGHLSDLRKDPTRGQWVLVRPRGGAEPAGAECPFCPGNEASTPPEIAAYRKGGGAPHARATRTRRPAWAPTSWSASSGCTGTGSRT